MWLLIFTSGTFYLGNHMFVYEGFLNIIVLRLPLKHWFYLGSMYNYGPILEERKKLMESRKTL